MSSWWSQCFGLIGLIVVLRLVLTITKAVWVYFLRPGQNLRKLGSWAVVTGATDGIGRALCDNLARKGLNVLLISRTESKLVAAAEEVAKKYNVQTKYTVVDFANADEVTWQRTTTALASLDVGLLINNVGLSYDHCEYLEHLSDQDVRNMVEVNITSVNQMTRIALPAMKAHHKGTIVNIGSASGSLVPATPLTSVYAGTKAYVDVFTRSMQVELAASGVTYQNMAPLFVATKMSKIRKPSIAAPSPAQWARAAVKHIGYETISCPYWFHAVEWYCIAVAPAWLMNMYVLNMHLGMRKRYYKKKNAKAQ
ncbi:MAG: hypothetical protein FRX49_02289 [Trebouxia sp. A1-2]|nr:MAG: hypothetical protein FRX49_02289 [Trebouxia sp. A1-2]